MKMCKKQQQMLRQNKIMEHMNLIYYTLKHINIQQPFCLLVALILKNLRRQLVFWEMRV